MCLQDQRMAAGGTARIRNDTVPAAGPVAMPDVTRALWVGVFTTTGVAVQLFYPSNAGIPFPLPHDAEIVGPTGAFGYYSRDICGSLFLGPLTYTADGVLSYQVTWFEADAETYHAIQPRPFEG